MAAVESVGGVVVTPHMFAAAAVWACPGDAPAVEQIASVATAKALTFKCNPPIIAVASTALKTNANQSNISNLYGYFCG